MTTYRDEIGELMVEVGDSWDNLVCSVLSEEGLDQPFDKFKELDFTVWTHDFVYFNSDYDGMAYVDRIARNPPGRENENRELYQRIKELEDRQEEELEQKELRIQLERLYSLTDVLEPAVWRREVRKLVGMDDQVQWKLKEIIRKVQEGD